MTVQVAIMSLSNYSPASMSKCLVHDTNTSSTGLSRVAAVIVQLILLVLLVSAKIIVKN